MMDQLRRKIIGKYKRAAARFLAQRPLRMQNHEPLISFTFDDFPRSALSTAGTILESYGLRGTYYTSLGLMGQTGLTGEIFHQEDLHLVLSRGHELGCHTFAHCPAHETPASLFERSIEENRTALGALEPMATFQSLSYPIGVPSPEIKRRTARYFRGSRAGGQTCNSGSVDLNNLRAFFIEQSRDRPEVARRAVDLNSRVCGWLIFATHDVSDNPTPYGCTPAHFEDIVKYAVDSGARVLPVSSALDVIGAP